MSREEILATPCPYCGVPRADHELASMMPHAMRSLGLSEDEADAIWSRVLDRITEE